MKTVKTFDGTRELNVDDIKKSYDAYPSYCRKAIGDDGTPYLSNCVETQYKCGCKIIGNGTLQFPLSIDFCEKHKL